MITLFYSGKKHLFLQAEPSGPGSSVSRQIPLQIYETNTPYKITLGLETEFLSNVRLILGLSLGLGS